MARRKKVLVDNGSTSIIYNGPESIDLYKEIQQGIDSGSIVAGSSVPLLVAGKVADETRINTTTLVIDDDLQVEVEENSVYSFELNMYYFADATPDLKWGWSYPTGATGEWNDKEYASQSLSLMSTAILTAGTGVNKSYTGISGRLITTNAGTFGLQWAQYVSSGNATKILKGSVLTLTKLN